jgi:hypothetical protein
MFGIVCPYVHLFSWQANWRYQLGDIAKLPYRKLQSVAASAKSPALLLPASGPLSFQALSDPSEITSSSFETAAESLATFAPSQASHINSFQFLYLVVQETQSNRATIKLLYSILTAVPLPSPSLSRPLLLPSPHHMVATVVVVVVVVGWWLL